MNAGGASSGPVAARFPLAGCLTPVVERELRIASRRPGTYWNRSAAALVPVLVLLTWTVADAPGSGHALFIALALIAAIVLLNGLMSLGSSAFAVEKREGTLGLLFLTPLKVWEIVLSKFVICALGAGSGFLATVPVLIVPLLGGGVSLGQVAFFVLVLWNHAFFVGALALLVSASCWHEQRARKVAALFWVGLCGVMPVIPAVLLLPLNFLPGMSWSPGDGWIFSPVYPLWHAVFSSSPPPGLCWASVGLTHLLGWWFLRSTCRRLPRCWQDPPLAASTATARVVAAPVTAVPPPSLTATLPAPRDALAGSDDPPAAPVDGSAGVSRGRVRLAAARADKAADGEFRLVWFASRWRAGTSWVVGLVVAVVVLLGGIGLLVDPVMLVDPMFVLLVCWTINAVLKVNLAHDAALAFSRKRPEPSLELLLATPVGARSLVEAHAAALRARVAPIARVALGLELVWLLLAISVHFNTVANDWGSFLVGIAIAVGLLGPDLRAVGWCAMWDGAVAPKYEAGASWTVGRILLLPWAVAGLVLIFLGGFGRSREVLAGLALLLVSVVVNRRGVQWARRRLLTELEGQARAQSAGVVVTPAPATSPDAAVTDSSAANSPSRPGQL